MLTKSKFLHRLMGIGIICLMAIVAPVAVGASVNIEVPSSFRQTQEDEKAWKRFSEILDVLESRYHRNVSGAELVDRLIEGVGRIDPHTSFLPPREFQEMRIQTRGEFGGLGIEIMLNRDGRPGILVISPIDDTPAARANMQPKDVIISIEGQSTENMELREAVDMLRGISGTDVHLTIIRVGEENPISITLTREIIQIQFVKHELRDDNIGYVRITSFGANVPAMVKDAVKKLVEKNGGQPLSGLVLDLQNNPGGLLDAADAVNDLFLDRNKYITDDMFYGNLTDLRVRGCSATMAQGTVTLSTERRGEIRPERCALAEGDILEGEPLLVLVNDGSASASEIVAGVLQIYGRAVIAGTETTFGKGTIQTVIPLRTGGAFRVTSAQYLIGPVGCEIPIQGLGVTPDIPLQSERFKTAAEERREQDLRNSLTTSTVSNENCRYLREVSPAHLRKAYEMLRVMGLEILYENPSQ